MCAHLHGLSMSLSSLCDACVCQEAPCGDRVGKEEIPSAAEIFSCTSFQTDIQEPSTMLYNFLGWSTSVCKSFLRHFITFALCTHQLAASTRSSCEVDQSSLSLLGHLFLLLLLLLLVLLLLLLLLFASSMCTVPLRP